jgi:hypothetical protein
MTGAGVTVAVGAAVGVDVTVGVAVAVEVASACGVTAAVGVALAVEVAGTELPPLDAGETEPFADGRNVVGDAPGGDDDVQPQTAAKPRTAMVPQPTAVSSARSAVPGMAVRTLFRYPAGQP